ncbi:hypothetical protein [Chryseobacterium sp. PMSZPI]|uniref:hypothetical protein n=1 Tax=Chryseobacterium sp. PMSZPI TaxID=1033900 RepID=UPI000C3317CC|nr:hypothetical protein [Chryseobacterium sp. PMSZPI]PKF73295.1 hypothetical protein CW752_14525 [Chryseobacterium sp. PMSZPI]
MKKISILLLSVPGFYFAQLKTPQGQIQATTNPETENVGIGISNPQSKLDVAGGINMASGFPIQLSGSDASHGLKYKRYNSDNTLLDGPYLYGWSSGALGIKKENGLEINILSWKETGSVGIGTNDPQAKLDVVGGINVASEFPIQLSGKDPSHGLKYKRYNSDNSLLDGPLLYGWLGGALGVKRTNGDEFNILSWKENGNVSVANKLEAKEIKVTNTPTADFVFETDYKLPDLKSVEKHIKEKKHLPEIASAKVMEKEGVNVGEFQIKLLQKIEELTLYTIEQNKRIEEQQERIKKLEEAQTKSLSK